MTTMRQACDRARSRLFGTLPPDLSILDGPYTAGSGEINLVIPKPKVIAGAMISVGLNTFVATDVGTGGTTIKVVSVDGEDSDCVTGERVYFRTPITTSMIFAEISHEIVSLSTPGNGLFTPVAVEYPTNYFDDTYPVPDDWTTDPLRVLRVDALRHGHHDLWDPVGRFVWQASQGIVRAKCPQWGQKVRVTYAMPFVAPVDLDTTFAEVGVSHWQEDIPIIGACANLAPGALDGRRSSPSAQSDTRRAQELTTTSGQNLASTFTAQKAKRIREEYSRLASAYPYQVVT